MFIYSFVVIISNIHHGELSLASDGCHIYRSFTSPAACCNMPVPPWTKMSARFEEKRRGWEVWDELQKVSQKRREGGDKCRIGGTAR
jgi:hypothetical protein